MEFSRRNFIGALSAIIVGGTFSRFNDNDELKVSSTYSLANDSDSVLFFDGGNDTYIVGGDDLQWIGTGEIRSWSPTLRKRKGL